MICLNRLIAIRTIICRMKVFKPSSSIGYLCTRASLEVYGDGTPSMLTKTMVKILDSNDQKTEWVGIFILIDAENVS